MPTGMRSGRPGPRLLAAAAAALVVVVWIASGSFVAALLVLVLACGVAGLGVIAVSWARPRPDPASVPATAATVDLAQAPPAGAGMRRLLRGALSRPWVRGDGLVRASAAKLASPDALVFTPRGQRVAAPHLWVEWNVADAAEVADRWPLETLAREFADDYVERAHAEGTRRLAERTWVHILGREDVPVGRVVVTAAFSEPQDAPLAAASSTSTALAPAPARHPPGGTTTPVDHPPGRSGSSDPTSHPVPASPPAPRPGPAARPAAPSAGPGRPRPRLPRTRALLSGRAWRVPAQPDPARPATTATATTAATTTAVADPPLVLVAQGPGEDVEVGGRPVLLGRDPRADVVLDGAGVSWHHLTVGPGPRPTVTDHGSTNGTFLDGRRIQAPTALRVGQELALGRGGPRFRVQRRGADGGGCGPVGGTRVAERTRQEAV